MKNALSHHNDETVCAVTVAFNNPQELNNLLLSLENQEYSIRGLIVIDNSNLVYAEENRKIVKKFEKKCGKDTFIRHIIIGKNIGSAHGYAIGMEQSDKLKFGWIWLLDQDGVTTPSSLQNLMKFSVQADILCASVHDNSMNHEVITGFRNRENIWGNIYPLEIKLYSSKQPQEIDFFASHGVLINTYVCKKIGYYHYDNFFVGGEDYEYSIRIKREGFNILLIPDACVYHPRKGLNTSQLKKKFDQYVLQYTPASWIVYKEMESMNHISIMSEAGSLYLMYKRLNLIQLLFSILFSLILCLTTLKNKSFKYVVKTIKIHQFCLNKKIMTIIRGDTPFTAKSLYGYMSDIISK